MPQDDDQTHARLHKEAEGAADYLEGLLDIANLDGDIEMSVRNERPVVKIVADDSSSIERLIGKNGEVVDSLQILTRLAVQAHMGERSHVIVDVDGYLMRKRHSLQQLALEAVTKARELGQTVDLPAMNSFERKIIHDAVRDEGLQSRSQGIEPKRYVTVFPDGAGVDSGGVSGDDGDPDSRTEESVDLQDGSDGFRTGSGSLELHDADGAPDDAGANAADSGTSPCAEEPER